MVRTCWVGPTTSASRGGSLLVALTVVDSASEGGTSVTEKFFSLSHYILPYYVHEQAASSSSTMAMAGEHFPGRRADTTKSHPLVVL